ncbi:MAG: MFS transporter, partial [Verrucomicrobiia bacterium]
MKLSKTTKFSYGIGELGPAMAGNFLIFYHLFFLTSVAGLPPAMASVIPLVGKIWDAINDPVIGWLSDKTRSRLGRRLPWMIWALPPCAVVFFLHWVVPGADGETAPEVWELFWFYLTVNFLYNAVSSAI